MQDKNLTIIMYHYVRDLKNSRFPKIKGLDVSLFKEQIQYLRKHYYLASMEEVIEAVDSGTVLPPKSVLLTFDDAYSDHFTHVFPILEKYNIQGSFYTPAIAICEHTVLDVNKIHFILASVEDKSIIINDIKLFLASCEEEYNLKTYEHYYEKLAKPNKRDPADTIFIKRMLQVELPRKLRLLIVDALFTKYTHMSEEAFSRELYMTTEQLEHLHRSGHHIGNHGYDHYHWNSLTEPQMEKELDLSIEFLKSLGVDMNKWTACYPYGSFDDQSIRLLFERGCKLAVTTEVDIARTEKSNRLIMPRLDTNDIPKSKNDAPNHWYYKSN